MLLLNFSHPLTPTHLFTTEQLTKQRVVRVINVKSQFDQEQPFAEQAWALVKLVGCQHTSGKRCYCQFATIVQPFLCRHKREGNSR
jgi:hypothetical protein